MQENKKPKEDPKPPFVVMVKFRDNTLSPSPSLEQVIGLESHLSNVIREYSRQSTVTGRLFTSVDPEYPMPSLESIGDRRIPNLLTWFRVEAPSRDEAETLVKRLGRTFMVEASYVQPPLAPAPTEVPLSQAGDRTGQQWYRERAPVGIGAAYLNVDGCLGEEVGFADVEDGWWLRTGNAIAHSDLPPAILSFNKSKYDAERHGVSVLGVVAAKTSNLGVVGIAPRVREIALLGNAIPNSNTGGWYTDTANAMAKARTILKPGDVLLLEVQSFSATRELLPSESERAVYDATVNLTAAGIIVVSAAGNGKKHLKPSRVDSGAILVGAGVHSQHGWMRTDRSNFGERIHCFAQGQDVCTTSFIEDPITGARQESITDQFSGTSSAAAIVAGAALAVQGMAKARGYTLSPARMRSLLSDPRNTQARPGQGIGVMPNLEWIASQL